MILACGRIQYVKWVGDMNLPKASYRYKQYILLTFLTTLHFGLRAMGSISFVDEMHRKNQGGEGPPIGGAGKDCFNAIVRYPIPIYP
jgi:hypothetical protein